MSGRNVKRAVWLLSPVDHKDISRLQAQWRFLPTAIARSYESLGLLPDGTEFGSIRSILLSAARGATSKWRHVVKASRERVRGEGFFSFVGEIFDAGGPNIVRDFAAVGIGWATWLAIWCSVIQIVLRMTVSVAHAATPASIQPISPGQDIALQALSSMISFVGSASTTLAQGLGQISNVLCVTAMTLTGIVIIWTTGVLTLTYLDSEDEMKSAYSVPKFLLRIVIGVGLLTPVGGGYDLGQRAVAQVGVWGSNQASKAWTAMVAYLADPTSGLAQPALSDVDIQLAVTGTIAAEACAAEINDDPAQSQLTQVRYDASSGRYDTYASILDAGWVPVSRGGCGTVVIPGPATKGVQSVSSTTASALISAQQQAFSTMRTNISTTINQMAKQHVICRDTGKCAADPDPSIVATWISSYRSDLQARVQSAMATSNQSAVAQLAKSSTSSGWIDAGSWMFSLGQLQSSLDGAASSLPRVSPPAAPTAHSFADFVGAWSRNGTVASGLPLERAQASIQSGSPSAIDDLFKAVAGGTVSLLPKLDSVNPLASVAVLGKWMYSIGLGMKTGAGLISYARVAITVGEAATAIETLGGSVVAGEVAKKGLRDIQEIISQVWFPIVILGGVLAYLVPMLPFIRFFFSVLQWLIAFMEVILLTPLALLVMVSAEKGGVFNGAAKACLWNVVALTVRPILTVAGFVIGIMMTSVMIGLLNLLMQPAIQNIEQSNFIFFGFIGYMFIYAGMAYVVVNSTSKIAESLPHAAYAWLGANAAGERDDASQVSMVLGGVVAKFGRGGGGSGGGRQAASGGGGGVSVKR